MATEITHAVRSELAPSGKLRVGLNHGNFLLVTSGSSGTDPKGVASDLARELGRRAGVPVEFIKFETADAERKMLDRLCVLLGIPKDIAIEIEADVPGLGP